MIKHIVEQLNRELPYWDCHIEATNAIFCKHPSDRGLLRMAIGNQRGSDWMMSITRSRLDSDGTHDWGFGSVDEREVVPEFRAMTEVWADLLMEAML